MAEHTTDQPASADDLDALAAEKPRFRRWRIYAGAAAALVMLVALFLMLRPVSVTTAQAHTGPAVESVYASGVVDFVRQARVAPVVSSPIRAVRVAEGQNVTRGQVLAELVDGPERANVLQLQAQAAVARAQARRTQQLFERGFAARAAYDDTRNQALAAEAAANAARAQLDDYRIRAPFTGRVMRRDAEPGDLATPANPLFVIADPSSLRITADVDERDAGRLREDMEALVRADAFPGQSFAARVSEVTPQGDSTGRIFRARLALEEGVPLRPGMTVEINIVLAQRDNALLVPTRALRDGAVFVVEDGRARRRAVQVGVQGAQDTEVREGLTAGARVILDPPANLRDGARIAERREGGD